MTDFDLSTFRSKVLDYYEAYGRHDMPWRIPEPDDSFDPYKIMVSELMLQQTQVARVTPKFLAFIDQFPTVQQLAAASLGEVLTVWSGLGYNRRAKFLHQAAQTVVGDFQGIFPATVEDLIQLPGVGKNTAGAIMAYAFNRPVVFIETNIRTVYIHHFFHDQLDIPDAAITELVQQTIDRENPRLFYWALMDYGAYLKQIVGNLNKLSKSYATQSTFEGSARQIRGKVIKLLAAHPCSATHLQAQISDDRLPLILTELLHEGLITRTAEGYQLG